MGGAAGHYYSAFDFSPILSRICKGGLFIILMALWPKDAEADLSFKCC